jgi:hypothetical protein
MTADRKEIKPSYYLIPFVAVKALAERFQKGLPYGRDNWKNGDKEWREDAFSHALEHLYKYNEGDTSEDSGIENLAAVMFYCATEIWHLHNKSLTLNERKEKQ